MSGKITRRDDVNPAEGKHKYGDQYPALVPDDLHGVAIVVELYSVSDALWSQIEEIELGSRQRGVIELADGRVLAGMLDDVTSVAQGIDISGYGGWAAYPYRAAANRTDCDPTIPTFDLFVNGTLMRGLTLHRNLRDAAFLGVFRTEPRYRLHSINDIHPGMYRLNDAERGGIAVPGELYRIEERLWPALEASEPPNLYRRPVVLEDGSTVWGILYPRALAEGIHPDISAYGGWRQYTAARDSASVG